MNNEWNLIKEWNNLTDDKKLTATLAIIILCLVSVILYYEAKLNRLERDFKKELKEKDNEKEMLNKNHIIYIQTSEREFKTLFFEIQKLKDK